MLRQDPLSREAGLDYLLPREATKRALWMRACTQSLPSNLSSTLAQCRMCSGR